VTPQGIITTVAGTGSCGFNGNLGLALRTELAFPEGLAVDATDNLYIADVFNQRVRKVDSAGTITTVAGNGTKGSTGDNGLAVRATLSDPSRLAVDRAGNLYISEFSGNRVRKVDANGAITTLAGNGATTR